MLGEAEARELDRLWDELLFIAQEPLEFDDAYEQILGYASQDRSDLVERWTPLKPAVDAYAEAFRKRLVEVEPRQVDAVVALAGRAFRRPLAPAEEARLRTLYDTLRKKEVVHEDAIRALVAHVLVSADFLYKIEVAGPGTEAKPVSDYELATRLSYLLWSSMPDAELLAAAEGGRLHDQEVLKSEVRRMLGAWPRSSARSGSTSTAFRRSTRKTPSCSPRSPTCGPTWRRRRCGSSTTSSGTTARSSHSSTPTTRF
jgi:hypothetical protein